MTLASGGESDVPACGPPASSAVSPEGSVHNSRGDNVVHMWVQLKRWWVLQRGHSGNGCDLASTLCKYDLRKGDLFVLSWAMVRRMRRGSLSSELIMCGGVVQYFVIVSCGYMPRDNRCMYMAHVCFYVCCSDCVGVW